MVPGSEEGECCWTLSHELLSLSQVSSLVRFQSVADHGFKIATLQAAVVDIIQYSYHYNGRQERGCERKRIQESEYLLNG